jgi:hypothetical protein
VQPPNAVEIYKGKEEMALLYLEGLEKKVILLPNEETAFTFTATGGFSKVLTTNTKGGEEYQLTIRIYSIFTGEKKVLQEMTINFKVPPYKP